MGNDWKVIGKRDATVRNTLMDVMSGGLTAVFADRDKVFTVEHTTTGELRTVTTPNEHTLGKLIEKGQFDDD